MRRDDQSIRIVFLAIVVFLSVPLAVLAAEGIPLPEHPRPDFERAQWANLNGPWNFRFDPGNEGLNGNWFRGEVDFPYRITVPFSWGSSLSGVEDKGDIGWYSRWIEVPASWEGQRVFLVIGACDWHTTAWIDGQPLGTHQGGYNQFEFDLTPHLTGRRLHRLVLRVDDAPHDYKLEGKQGYGRAAGIWQTVYLEARPEVALETVHFTPDLDKEQVSVRVTLDQAAAGDISLELRFRPEDRTEAVVSHRIPDGEREIRLDIPLGSPRLWNLDDPYLYEVTVLLKGRQFTDEVSTYFGMRKIGVVPLPGTKYPYIAVNDKPVYLQMSLDQAYHPEGYYTFPSDEFMRDEILRSRQIGLNGQRIHIKVEIPRKLYWADRLGVLIMADVPNFWGPPSATARKESEKALREMIRRDYNHPSIFSWVLFNETWGLQTPASRGDGNRQYLPETQQWVERMFELTKKLDATRLVEDNSANRGDHVVTDINSWHAYLPGYLWKETLDQISDDTYPGSEWNFVEGRVQGNEPNFNSECGNVWGYEGSTGDVDWSWDYHLMINEFRRHPKVCGWLYTEHHDVINEWNGYWRYDRSEKFTGLSELVPGMTLEDLHSPFYLATEREMCREVMPGEVIDVPLYASFMADAGVGESLNLLVELYGWDSLGRRETYVRSERQISYEPWMNRELEPLQLQMPNKPVLAVLALVLEDQTGTILHRNFTTYLVSRGVSKRDEEMNSGGENFRVVRFSPADFEKAEWSLKQWSIMEGLKVNGAGNGYFEYHVEWPSGLKAEDVSKATIRMEVSAKQLFGKDREDAGSLEGDYMRGRGAHDPSLNPNSYPMTDESKFPSAVRIRIGQQFLGVFDLADDPADHRGILSWYSQNRNAGRGQAVLKEAGSYGQLVEAHIPLETLKQGEKDRKLVIRLEVDEGLPGGLAVYGERFGRFPLDPTLVFVLK